MPKKGKPSELNKLFDLQIRFDYLTALRMDLEVESSFPDYPHE